MTTAAKSAKGAGTADSFDAFSLGMQNFEIPGVLRDAAERSVTQAKDMYAKTRAAAEEATDLMENAYENARQSARAMSLKALEAAQVHADASFALFRDLMGARTFADAVELQTAFTRKQFDAASAQMKEFQEAAQKAWQDAAAPARDAMVRSFGTAAAPAATKAA